MKCSASQTYYEFNASVWKKRIQNFYIVSRNQRKIIKGTTKEETLAPAKGLAAANSHIKIAFCMQVRNNLCAGQDRTQPTIEKWGGNW